LEPEFLDAGLEGGGPEAKEGRGAGRAADASVGQVQHGSDMRALVVVIVPGRLTHSRTPRGLRRLLFHRVVPLLPALPHLAVCEDLQGRLVVPGSLVGQETPCPDSKPGT
jgi:hypothetical protein